MWRIYEIWKQNKKNELPVLVVRWWWGLVMVSHSERWEVFDAVSFCYCKICSVKCISDLIFGHGPAYCEPSLRISALNRRILGTVLCGFTHLTSVLLERRVTCSRSQKLFWKDEKPGPGVMRNFEPHRFFLGTFSFTSKATSPSNEVLQELIDAHYKCHNDRLPETKREAPHQHSVWGIFPEILLALVRASGGMVPLWTPPAWLLQSSLDTACLLFQ